jgi:hypothetical protein
MPKEDRRPIRLSRQLADRARRVYGAADRLLWKIEKAYSLGIPKKNLARGKSQTEEEHAYGEKYTIFRLNGRSFWT